MLSLYRLSRRLSSRIILPFFYKFTEVTPNFKKVVNFEKLRSTLSEMHDPNEILNLYHENQSHFSKGDLVTALRGICRCLKSAKHVESTKDNEIVKNPKFQALVNSTVPIIEKLSPRELLDLLFCIRKIKWAGEIGARLPREAFIKLLEGIDRKLMENVYSPRDICFIYYDYSFLKRYSDTLVEKLYEIFSNDPNFLDVNLFIQMLQASSQKQAIINMKEWGMLDAVIKRGNFLVRDVDLEKKCLIFKYVAQLELSFNPMRFDYPLFFNQIKEEIKYRIYDMTENSLLAIIQSYQILPMNFYSDLFVDVIELIKTSLETNREAITSVFLLEIISEMNKIKIMKRRDVVKSKLDFEKEILNRLKDKDKKFLDPKSFNKVAEFFHGYHYPINNIIKCYYDILVEQNIHDFNTSFFFELCVLHKLDVAPFLQKYENEAELAGLKITYKARFYLILQELNDPKFETMKNQCEIALNKFISEDPIKVAYVLNASLLNTQAKKDILAKCFDTVVKQNPLALSDTNICHGLIEMITNEHLYKKLMDFAFSGKTVQAFFGVLLENLLFLSNINEYQMNLILHMMSNYKFDRDQMNRLFLRIKGNASLLTYLSKDDYLFALFIEKLVTLFKALPEKEKIRLPILIGALLRENSFQSRNEALINIFDEVLCEFINKGIDRNGHRLLLNYLIINSYLSPKTADAYLAKSERKFDYKVSNYELSRILNISVMNKTPSPDVKITIENNFNSIVADMKITSNQKFLPLLITALTFPDYLVEKEKNFFLKVFLDQKKSITAFQFNNLLTALNNKYLKSNPKVYEELIREILEFFKSTGYKIVTIDAVLIINIIHSSGLFYNKFEILNKKLIYHKLFKNYFAGPEIIRKMADMRIINREFFDNFFTDIQKTKFIKSNIISWVLEDFYSLGYNSESYANFLTFLLNNQNEYTNKSVLFQILISFSFSPELEKQTLDKFLSESNFSENNFLIRDTDYKHLALIDEYLTLFHEKNPEYRQNLRKLIKINEQEFDQEKLALSELSLEKKEAIKRMESINEKVIFDYPLEKTQIKLNVFFPDKNQAILICGINDLYWNEKEGPVFLPIDTIRDTILSGKTRIILKIYEKVLEEKKLNILNAMSFLSKEKEDLSKLFAVSAFNTSFSSFESVNLVELAHDVKKKGKENIIERESSIF